jgi:predicted HicB family RNase H-like nuclease
LLGVAKGDAKVATPAPAPSTNGATGKVALTLRIAPALHDRLRLAAFEQRRPMQDIILEALASHLGG